MTGEQWAQLIAAVVGALTAAAAYLQSRRASTTATEAKHAAENGVTERTALRERAEKAEQSLTAMQMQRDTFRDIVRYVQSHPEATSILAAYAERRRVSVHDSAVDALIAPVPATPPAPSSALAVPGDWRPWAAGGALAALLTLIGAALALRKKVRP